VAAAATEQRPSSGGGHIESPVLGSGHVEEAASNGLARAARGAAGSGWVVTKMCPKPVT
jgi:hypothetical protein